MSVAPPTPTLAPATAAPLLGSGLRQRVSDVVALTKPKVQLLLLLTTVTAMYAAGDPSPTTVVATLLGGSLASGGASAVNHWYDRDIDAVMDRTLDRPIPSGRMAPHVVLWIGLWLTIAAFFLLALAVNITAAVFAMAGFAWYVGVYTVWLKRRWTQNIIVGGLAGAFPPLVGWAATTGSFAWESLWPFAIIFAWTGPHFWALSLLIKEDYAKASVPMLPAVKGDHVTHRAIVAWSVVTVAVTIAPVLTGTFGLVYLVVAVGLGVELLRRSVLLLRRADRAHAVGLHLYALAYLAVLFAAMVLDAQL